MRLGIPDDDGDSVCVFGDAYSRAVACAQVFRQSRIQSERKEAGGCGYAMATNDDRAVMQRSRGIKNRNEQVVA